jgi:threonine dehydrogenase-like Zn-dependent dehydrogenase
VVVGCADWDAAADACVGGVVAAGAPAAVTQGLRLARRGGEVVVLGLGIGTAGVDVDAAVRRELSLVGAFGSVPADWLDAVDLIASGRVTGAGIVSHELTVAEGPEGFALLAGHGARKIVIRPQEG